MNIDTQTRLYGVFGHPVAHSLSPAMHNRAFEAVGTNGVYLAFDVSDIGPAVSGGRALGLRGWSVTIPHKVAVMPLMDDLDPPGPEDRRRQYGRQPRRAVDRVQFGRHGGDCSPERKGTG